MKLPIPQDWDNESWCCYAVEWPESEGWKGVLRGFLTLAQRGWTWDERTGSILAVQEIGREITARNLPEKECIMACGEELAAALLEGLQAIATAQSSASAIARAAGCCEDRVIDSSGGYQGTIDTAGGTIPIYGSVPPYEPEEGEEYPPEFDSQEQFDQHKCSVAYAIFDGVMLTVNFLAGLNMANIVGLAGVIGAAIAGILIFPPSAIPILIGALLAVGGFMAMFLEIRNAMLDEKQEFICAMYNSASTEAAIAVIADLLDVIILGLPVGGAVGFALKTVMLLLFNSDTLNQLYETSVDILYPDADCSQCCEECTSDDNLTVDFSSGWAIDDQFSGLCAILGNQGDFTFSEGVTLDLSASYPGQVKFLNVVQSVEEFNLVQNTMHFEFEVLSEAVSCYWHLIFSDGTCEGHGPGTAETGAHVIETPLDAENFCKTVTHFVFSVGASSSFEPATVSITSAELTCEE